MLLYKFTILNSDNVAISVRECIDMIGWREPWLRLIGNYWILVYQLSGLLSYLLLNNDFLHSSQILIPTDK